ncbi:MAG: hypothetical protein GY859_32850 [Desulfobacterales bacterium]|nr:hypothetical protein [Desulfobacterales bacterium]
MTEYELDQTLIATPETSFNQIAAVLKELGWSRDETVLAAPPLVEGEPELATWTWEGGKPWVSYTFNPVARLRVLDVAGAAPSFRGMIADRIPLLGRERMSSLLTGAEAREKLLGLWAIRETERIDAIPDVTRLFSDPESVVAEQAKSVAEDLERIARARITVLTSLRTLTDAAPALIEQLSDADFVQGLRPTRADCAGLFDEELADAAARGAARLYEKPLTAAPGNDYPEIDVVAAPAGLLRSPNELSRKFPLGYRTIAGWMTPNRIWLTWAFRSPKGGAVRYDGLAWLEDHWIWLPKPFRIIAPLLHDPTGH